MYTAKRIKCHVYLENVEIDFTSISLLEQKGSPPRAVVNVPPVKNIFNIMPKTVCIITADLEMRDVKSGTVVLNADRTPLYKETVIFFGEFTGTGLNRTPASAEVQLMFDGFLNNWATNSIVPVDASIPTAAESVMLGINYRDLATQSEKGLGILYNRFPTMLLSFINFFDESDEASTEKKKYLAAFPPNGGRSVAKTKLMAFWKASNTIPSTPKHAPRNAGISLQNAFAVTTRHFLLNYGLYLASHTRSFLMESMINYVGSNNAQNIVSNVAVVAYLKAKTNGLIAEGTMPVARALQHISSHMKYTFQEFAAPVITSDSMNPNELCASKVLFHPESVFFSPIANNVFFDDDIVTVNMSRNWSSEPTRVIYMGNPLITQDKDGQNLIPMMLATVAPANIIVGKTIDALAKSSENAIDKFAVQAKKSEDAEKVLAEVMAKLKSDTQSTKEQKEILAAYASILVDDTKENEAAQRQLLEERALPILRLSQEELIRGVVPVTENDPYSLEAAFLLSILNSKISDPKKKKETVTEAIYQLALDKSQVDTTKDILKSMNMANAPADTKALMRYYLHLANLAYMERRRAARTLTMQSVFSPHRVVGMSSLLLMKDIGPVTAVLASMQTNISANGEATQFMTFTHVSILRLVNSIGIYSDALDNFTDDLPAYLDEFEVDSVGEKLYVYLNGRDNASLFDFCLNNNWIKKPTKGSKEYKSTTLACADIINEEYQKKTTHGDLDEFTYRLTHRRLMTFPELMAMLKEATAAHTPRDAKELVKAAAAPRPFVKQRQQAILDIFREIDPKIEPVKGY